MHSETCLLYHLARLSSGNIAEQGPFLGASTIALASGLRASERSGRRFITTDAFPTHGRPNRSVPHYWQRWHSRKRAVGKKRKELMLLHIDGKHVGTLPLDQYNAHVRPYIDVPGGQRATLLFNLRAAGVDDLVQVAVGSSIPIHVPFELVWSDATHNEKEINSTVPLIMKRIATTLTSRDTCVTFAFHDIFSPGQVRFLQVQGARGGEQDLPLSPRRLAIDAILRAHRCVPRARAAARMTYSVTCSFSGIP